MIDVGFDHLRSNLKRLENEYFSNKIWLLQPTPPSTDCGDYKTWLIKKNLLLNTRLIIEPKIAGCSVGLNYEDGILKSAIINNGLEIISKISHIKNIPKNIPIANTLRVQGDLYALGYSSFYSKLLSQLYLSGGFKNVLEIRFAALYIFNTNLNQYSQLQALKNLGFEIPPNEFTRLMTSEVEIYRRLWQEKKIFIEVPTDGIVLKVNSRKLQKYLGESHRYFNWAYSITS